ncbi:hypothetical protein A9Q75_19605 [Colwellia psychrerythraea]|uniref:Uncharacterized protein n=1 Tax=Colwellia psychrerythraea TaxID=28229 RepID=A0A1Y5E190_COLPS|nr:hypothetical protein A9Q75_19605 [Colwellia psychrerythraea]
MSTYNTITKMGLADVENISHHTLSSKGNEDILKVYLKTSDDSVFPDSCCFHFERTKPGCVVDSLEGSNPTLVKAVEELNLITKQQSNSEYRERLLNDLEKLELVMASKLKELRSGLDLFE